MSYFNIYVIFILYVTVYIIITVFWQWKLKCLKKRHFLNHPDGIWSNYLPITYFTALSVLFSWWMTSVLSWNSVTYVQLCSLEFSDGAYAVSSLPSWRVSGCKKPESPWETKFYIFIYLPIINFKWLVTLQLISQVITSLSAIIPL